MHNRVTRRAFLRGAGVALALPTLDAMTAAGAPAAAPPRRMIAIQTNQGILPRYFFPKTPGKDYELTPYLKTLADFRGDMTVFSGVSHPEVDGGHSAEPCYLTAAPHPGRAGFRNSISLDQFAAERIGHLTRFPSLTLAVGTRQSLSFTGAGVMIPADDKPSAVFRKLFVRGSAAEVREQIEQLRRGRSILDSVAGRAKQLSGRVGPGDRAKLDQYFTGVRELERRLVAAEEWERRPKPKVNVKVPGDFPSSAELIRRARSMFSLAKLAVETDSTRAISLFVYQNNGVKLDLPDVEQATHPLTHHGNRPEKLRQLKLIETAQFRELARLLGSLRDTPEAGGSLLDSTMVLYGTSLGDGNRHSNTNLPTVLAGGGFRHGSHLAFDKANNEPLSKLFVSMLQRLGVEAGRFADGEGTIRGLG